MIEVSIDHIFKHSTIAKYRDLKNYGLAVDLEKVVEHPGRRFCRHVKMDKGYLEWIHERTTRGPFSILDSALMV